MRRVAHIPILVFGMFVALPLRAGEIGVVVQSQLFAIGPLVPWAEAGSGQSPRSRSSMPDDKAALKKILGDEGSPSATNSPS